MGRLLILLLDTHALLWWWIKDTRLSMRAQKAIADENNTVLVSAASAWEIATKYRIGKLPDAKNAVSDFAKLINEDGFSHLAVAYQHALMAGGFDHDHRDPFDRILAAQAIVEGAYLVTCDKLIKQFKPKCYW